MQLLRQRFLGIAFFLSQYFDVITQHNCVLLVFDGFIISPKQALRQATKNNIAN